MPVLDHIHTYERWKVGNKDKIMAGEPVYRCASADCTHYCVKSLIVGKRSLCTQCGNEIILDKEALRRIKPKCLNCSNTKARKALGAATDLLQEFHLFPDEELIDVGQKASKIEEVEKENRIGEDNQ